MHGYSANSKAFKNWENILEANGYKEPDVTIIHTASYKSLTNEVTIKDIAEAFDRALRIRVGLKVNEPFDAIVHSTGMLVIRAWLTTYAERRDRLQHLIGLAPATFGSPLAHKGRSWLGSIFQGFKHIREPDKNIFEPDFLEAGDLILDSLELGSRFTWDLAHLDLIGPAEDKPDNKPYYGKDSTTPYVFIFCGNKGYDGVSGLVNTPGSDGTVRWAGCALNTRKFTIDLTQDSAIKDKKEEERAKPIKHPEKQIDIPVVLVEGKDHGTIMSQPDPFLVDMVLSALKVSTEQEFNDWKQMAAQHMDTLCQKLKKEEKWEEWQQFIIRVVDERKDPVPDWNIQFYTKDDSGQEKLLHENSDMDVYTYSRDKSIRCFHVNLTKLKLEQLSYLSMQLIASSGSRLVGYYGYGSERITADGTTINQNGVWDAKLDLTHLLSPNAEVQFFRPFTTTLVEIRLNREPLPITRENLDNRLLKFGEWSQDDIW